MVSEVVELEEIPAVVSLEPRHPRQVLSTHPRLSEVVISRRW